jgi:hypothetical protein
MSRILSNAAHQSIPSGRTSVVSQSYRVATSSNERKSVTASGEVRGTRPYDAASLHL